MKQKILSRRKHGLSDHALYRTWQCMMARCYNKKAKAYHNYGGRGIRVCERWHYVENYIKDLENKKEGRTVDRINNDGNYCLENIKWSTPSEQVINQRRKKREGYQYVGTSKSSTGNWRARITVRGKHYYKGIFKTEKEAAIYYNKLSKDYHGLKGFQNIIKSLLIIFLIASPVFSKSWDNKVDKAITEKLAWENTTLAAGASDIFMYSLNVAPWLYTITHKQDRSKRLLATAIGQGFTVGVTHLTKEIAGRTRPNGQGSRSFFSGHTSSSFVSAALLGSFNKRLLLPGILMAGTVGYLRISARKHWWSDCIIAAGVGIGGSVFPRIIVRW